MTTLEIATGNYEEAAKKFQAAEIKFDANPTKKTATVLAAARAEKSKAYGELIYERSKDTEAHDFQSLMDTFVDLGIAKRKNGRYVAGENFDY
jgi:hypothetical protein